MAKSLHCKQQAWLSLSVWFPNPSLQEPTTAQGEGNWLSKSYKISGKQSVRKQHDLKRQQRRKHILLSHNFLFNLLLRFKSPQHRIWWGSKEKLSADKTNEECWNSFNRKQSSVDRRHLKTGVETLFRDKNGLWNSGGEDHKHLSLWAWGIWGGGGMDSDVVQWYPLYIKLCGPEKRVWRQICVSIFTLPPPSFFF